MKYYINYNTGAGSETIEGTLQDAMKAADQGACYTQESITIEDETGIEIARRSWYGVEFDPENDPETKDPIKCGAGYYGDWWSNDYEI